MKKDQKVDRRVEKTRKSIRNALVQLMERKDISQITIKELSEEAQINRKTFYTHYASIYDMLDEIENEIIEDLLSIFNQYQVKERNFATYDLFMNLNRLLNSDLEFYRQLIRVNSQGMFLVKIKSALKDALVHIVREQVKVSEVELSMCTEYVASGIMAMYTQWFLSDQSISLEKLASIASTISIRGAQVYFTE